MPCTINPIRKALVKKSLLKGNSIRQALKDGGYKPGTQRGNNNGTTNILVKTCQAEIERDIKKIITVDYVLEKLKYFVDNAKNDADRIRATELLGKWQAMFTDKTENTTKLVIKPDEVSELNRLRGNLFDVSPCVTRG